MEKIKVTLTGPSGVGKTTLAKEISNMFTIPFISGSYSDLVPETRNERHEDMINKEPKTIFEQDMQVLCKRRNAFNVTDTFVSDRSYIDSAAYIINKLSHRYPECEIDSFCNLCKALTKQTTHIIFIPFSKNFMNHWEMEDNNKRVLNRYYQFEVSQVIFGLLDLWGYRNKWSYCTNTVSDAGIITIEDKEIPILILDELDFNNRVSIVRRFLKSTENL